MSGMGFGGMDGALNTQAKLLAEIDRLRAELETAKANYQFMAERAADQKLDGYRELGAKAAAAENECDRLRAENAALREALEELADLMDEVRDGEYTPDAFTNQVARAALSLADAAPDDYRARIRREALEEAARECESLNPAWEVELGYAADRIRDLMEKP